MSELEPTNDLLDLLLFQNFKLYNDQDKRRMVNGKRVGIGITTYNRPDFLKHCLDSLVENVKSADVLFIYNDGSKVDYKPVFSQITKYEHLPFEQVTIIDEEENHGVAHAKNTLLKKILEQGCDYIFLLEDDILIKDDLAITEYIRIGDSYGYHHMMFAHHGPANVPYADRSQHYEDKEVAYWPNCIGAWCMYTRECLEGLESLEKNLKTADNKDWPYPGFMDENFHNAWEHVEHTVRLGNNGYTAWLGLFPDCLHSKEWICEQEDAIAKSSIRPDNEWTENMKKGMAYWQTKHGDKFPFEELTVNLDAKREGVKDEQTTTA